MNRTILTGVLVMATGFAGLWAQTPAAPPAGTAGTAGAAGAPTKGPKSKAEATAIMAVQNGTDPDAIIKAAEDLMAKFADTDFKEFAYSMEARAYQQKHDDVNAQVYGERAIALNPKSYMMQMLVAEVTVASIKDHDLDRAEKIKKTGDLFNAAIENCKAAVKPNPQVSDSDWTNSQNFVVAEAHNGLGMLALTQRKYADAIKEFQSALELDSAQDAYATRLASAYLSAGKKPECLAICDKLLAKPDLHPQIKQVITSLKAAASK